jgi:hypothetical protein
MWLAGARRSATVDRRIGHLDLDAADIGDLLAFLETLIDAIPSSASR